MNFVLIFMLVDTVFNFKSFALFRGDSHGCRTELVKDSQVKDRKQKIRKPIIKIIVIIINCFQAENTKVNKLTFK